MTIVLTIAALFLVPHARFDSDPLKLRDQKSEALSTFLELRQDPNIPTLTLSALAPDADAARALSKQLSALPLVGRVLSLPDFVPVDQDQKLPIIEDLVF